MLGTLNIVKLNRDFLELPSFGLLNLSGFPIFVLGGPEGAATIVITFVQSRKVLTSVHS